jgi:hypothetical protein
VLVTLCSGLPHEHATLYPLVEPLLPQVGASRGCRSAKLFRLQLYQDSPCTADESRNGRWRHRSAMGWTDLVALWESYEQRRVERAA